MGHVTWPSLAFTGRAAVEVANRFPEDLELSAPARNSLSGRSFLGPSTTAEPRDRTILFLQSPVPEVLARMSGLRDCLIILPVGSDPGSLTEENAVLLARNPKYAYARLMTELFPLPVQRGTYGPEQLPGVQAASGFVLEEGVTLEPFVTVGPDSSIGKGSYVMKGATIGPRVRIGRYCVIGEGAVIGSPGFGFAFDGDRPPLRLPHLGGVLIEDRVEIGVCSGVDSGTIDSTVVEGDVKMNSHVHIAHNCRIGRGSVLGASVSVSGSAEIGERCWLGPGAVVRNKVKIGPGVTVGMGAVVVKNVESGWTVTGVPAKPTGNVVPWYESETGIP